MKTKDLKPCDGCGGPIVPVFYRIQVEFNQVMVDVNAANAVLGTAMIFGGNLRMGSLMSPDADVLINLPGFSLKKDIWLCATCILSDDLSLSISPCELFVEAGEVDDEGYLDE